MSATISENFEIICLKWLEHHTCAPVKPNVTNENLIFFSSLCMLTLKSKEVKYYQKWLKMGLNQNFTVLF